MSEAVLLIGTKKGLWVGRSDAERHKWELEGPQFEMQGVYSVGIDTRGDRPRLFVGGTSEHWGPAVFHSDDLGRSWDEPPKGSITFPEDTGASLGSGRSSPAHRTSRTSSMPVPNRPRCGGRPTEASPSSSSAACGSTPTARSGVRGSAVRRSTACCRTRRTGSG
jgi:hypothetical protein